MRLIGRVLLLLVVVGAGWAQAQSAPEFPALTGRVVDQADILSPQAEANLTRVLAEHEQATTNQVVVVTLPNLQGYEIADYGYQLGRHWGIGQKGKDNGVLLIVALEERKMRIEVGYGLEGQLTDAASSLIINRVMVPMFQQGQLEQGVIAGVGAILTVLQAEPGTLQAATPAERDRSEPVGVPFLITFLFFVILMFLNVGRGRRIRRYRRGVYVGGLGGFGGRGFRGGGFGGGGFGGGGGGFGGGGASGGW